MQTILCPRLYHCQARNSAYVAMPIEQPAKIFFLQVLWDGYSIAAPPMHPPAALCGSEKLPLPQPHPRI